MVRVIPSAYKDLRPVPMKEPPRFPQIPNVGLIPIAFDDEEFGKIISKLFSNKQLNNLFQYLVYPKRVIGRSIFNQAKKIENLNAETMETIKEKHFPHFQRMMKMIIGGSSKSIMYTPPVFEFLNWESSLHRRPKLWAKFINVIPEFLNWVYYGNDPEHVKKYQLFDHVQWTLLPAKKYFDNLIFTIPINTTDLRVALYLGSEHGLPYRGLIDPHTNFAWSAIQTLMYIYTGAASAIDTSLIDRAEFHKVTFFFYNDETGFFINADQLKQSNMPESRFVAKLKLRLRMIISQNRKEPVPQDVLDELAKEASEPGYAETEEEQKENADPKTYSIIDADKSSNEFKEKVADLTIKAESKIINTRTSDVVRDIAHSRSQISDNEVLKAKVKKFTGDKTISEDTSDPIEQKLLDEAKELEDTIERELEKTSLEIEAGEKALTEADVKKLVDREIKPKRTPAQDRRIAAAKEKYKSIKIGEKTIGELLDDSSYKSFQALEAPVSIRDASLKKNTVVDMDAFYRDKVFERDIMAAIQSFGHDNKHVRLFVTNVEKTDTSDQFTAKDTYHLTFEDEFQKKHAFRLDVPKIDENGFLYINGNKKILKKQLVSLPIIKIKPDQVSVSSNYNKVLVYRQGTTLNKNVVILKKIFEFMIEQKSNRLKVFLGKNDNSHFMSTLEYDGLANNYHKIIIGAGESKFIIYFNQSEIREIIKGMNKKVDPNELPYAIDYATKKVYSINLTENKSLAQAMLEELYFRVPGSATVAKETSVPKKTMYSRIMIQSKQIPLIAFLGSLYGLKKVLDAEKIQYHFSTEKLRGDERPCIKFQDGFLYYDQYPLAASLLVSGLTDMSTETENFADMETPIPYIEYIFDAYKTRNLYKGWVAFKELFLDPITLEVLADNEMPTDFLEVFLYANKLLEDNHKENEKMRVRGFETMSAIMYGALARNYQVFKQKVNPKNRTFSVQQDEIFAQLHKSFILENYDAINPVNELKMKHVVTYKGPQGINTDEAFTLEKRAFTDDMVGIIGMSSVDSSGVGIVKHLVINPNIKTVRGYFDSLDNVKEANDLTISQTATPEEAILPFVNKHDDPKRIGFASNQTKHMVSVKQSDPPLIGTGLDQSIAYKISNVYAQKAKSNGIVLDVDEEHGFAIVQYEDGSKESVRFGNQINRNSSFFLNNPLALAINKGQKFKKGEILTYNKEFFHKIGNRYLISQGPLCRLVLIEDDSTEEDSSDITESFAEKLATTVINRKQIGFGVQSNISKWVSVGDHISAGDPMMLLEDFDKEDEAVSSMLSSLGPADEDTMAMLKRHAPTSKYTGVIQEMHVYWTVPESEMNDSCRKFIASYKRRLLIEIKKEEAITGQTSHLRKRLDFSQAYRGRINGVIVSESGGIVVEYFISKDNNMGVGDKLTYNSSLKSIIAHVIPKGLEPYSEFGDTRVDATLGSVAIAARMVTSVYHVGFMNKILYERGRQIAEEYLKP